MTEPGVTADRFFLSVVMCTRNRAASLEYVLDSICKMTIPPGQRWEMVVVDNGSTDATPSVIENFKNRLPIRGVFEPAPGLSNARNRGVAAALGDYILWTDDDVEVDAGWLAGYASAIARFPDAVLFGGRIIPRLEPPSPVWFKENVTLLADILALRDLGDDGLPLSEEGNRLPYGANYAIRTAEQRQYLYDPELGVSPGTRRVGEETKVIKAILAAGHRGYWAAEATVFHIIPNARQTEKYIRDYFGGQGQTHVFRMLSKGKRTRSQAIFHHGSRLLANVVLFYAYKAFLPPRHWLRRLMALGHHFGALDYAYKYRIGKSG